MPTVQRSAARMRVARSRGLTLVELMVTLAIFGILVGIAAPSMQSIMLGPRLTSYANSFTASATLARSEAIKRNTSVTLCASSDGTSCASSGDWEQGWIVLAGTEVVQRQQAINSQFKVIETLSSARSLSFSATGLGATQASMRICQATPSAGLQERVITISATGRSSVSTTRNGICA